MRTLSVGLLVLGLASSLAAQGTPVDDVGLTMSIGGPAFTIGQQCGTVTCQSVFAGNVGRGQILTLVHSSAPVTPYAMAIGLPGPCTPIPGLGGALLIGAPIHTLEIGMTSTEPFVPTPCSQGVALYMLTVPTGAPLGFTFRVQSVGFSRSGPLALGPAVEATIV